MHILQHTSLSSRHDRQFNALVGHATRVECPALKTATGALPAVMEIPNFAATLKAGEFRAVDVARDQVEIEVALFWLCRLMEPAFQTSSPIVFAGESLEEGYWL